MMSKKYYTQFAEIIKISESVDEIKQRMIMLFSADNPAFDRARFEAACKKVN